MPSLKLALFSLACCVSLTGCVTMPGEVSSFQPPSYVGADLSKDVGQVQLSVPDGPEGIRFHNLHIQLRALIDAEEATLSSRYDVYDILSRSEASILAAVIDHIQAFPEVNVRNLPQIRQESAAVAQKTFDAIFSQWKGAKAFKVKILATSIYFDDKPDDAMRPLGPPPAPRHWD